jgi:outer membrane lipoprotein-sorting protein
MFKDEADFEKVVSRLNVDTELNPSHRQKLRRQMLSVFNQAEQKPATRIIVFRTVRSIIMKSPATKIAATAAIIIAVLIGFLTIGSSTPAFAEIVKPFLTARTASFKMTMEVEGVPTQTFDCLYAEPIRMRQTNKEQGAIVISDLQKGKIVTLMPAQKKAYVMELENVPDDQDQSGFNLFGEIRKHILEAQKSEDASVEFLGEKKINDMTTIGYHVKKPGVEITVWADPKTKLPVQLTNTMEPTTYTMTEIVFDVEFDESLLSLEIPAEYTVHTMQVDASEPTEEDLINMFRIWAEHMDDSLPSTLEMNEITEFVQYQRKKLKEQGFEPTEKVMLEWQQTITSMGRGGMFVQALPSESDWHYAGKDVKFGEAEKPIFWYRPEGSQNYRVIYGDLSIKDVAPENLPQ